MPLGRYFAGDYYHNHLNYTNPLGSKGKLAMEFATMVKIMRSGKIPVISPLNFKLAVGSLSSQFNNSIQQDAQEFLSFLLGGLHEDLNISKRYHNNISESIIPELQFKSNVNLYLSKKSLMPLIIML